MIVVTVAAEVVNASPSEATFALDFRTTGSADVQVIAGDGPIVVPPGGSASMPVSVEVSEEAATGAQATVEVYASDQRYGPTVAAPLAVAIGA